MPVQLSDFDVPTVVQEKIDTYSSGLSPFQRFAFQLPIPFPIFILLLCLLYNAIVLIGYIIYDRNFRPKSPKRTETLFSSEGDPFCRCCLSVAEIFNCCRMTSIDACLNGICPQRQTHDCADIMFCQLCGGRPGSTDACCPIVECPVFCQSVYCEDTVCCCFRCNFRERPLGGQQERLL